MRYFFFIASKQDRAFAYKKTSLALRPPRPPRILCGRAQGPSVLAALAQSMPLVNVELDAQEAMTLLHLVRTRQMEVDRMVQNMEEGEGMDLQRHNALKTMRPQQELLDLLALKLEGATRELEGLR